ncbi:ubiquitinspecific protease [Plasmopara halstedii]|uniref:Ubiquitinspecific protease n=1 Tax=Plasmopara halstedii TaxID=4781 RepID=A0A0P1B6V5_PLAHL|nr:ubiquitinspecific protease [Plasmopara halstedii]CEG49503.1 ubiquitinspecific protease [Plasmopara halstedii]|eukprot:XP_024585872.1 ubiquitinspecific protease [Plasmopara halstedii]
MAWKSFEPPNCDADDWFVVTSDDERNEDYSEVGSSQLREKQSDFHTSKIKSSSLDPSEPLSKTFSACNKEIESPISPTRRTFKLLVWYSGLELPIEVVDETQKVLTVTTEGCLNQEMIREMVLTQSQLCQIFPHVTKVNVNEMIQACERLQDEMKWVPLQSIEKDNIKDGVKVSTLQLKSQIQQSIDPKCCQLLIETRFESKSDGKLQDWRCGRFFSDVLENTWRFELKTGQLIDALDTNKRWYESRIVDTGAVYVKIHYRGWTNKWDEWLRRTSTRLAPLHTKVPNWRAFQVNDEVLVGTEVSSKSYPEWRNARVTACARKGESYQIEVDVDGKKKWMDTQDELLCQKGTHKAVNTSVIKDLTSMVVPHTLLVDYFERPKKQLPCQEQPVDKIESISQATQVMQSVVAAIDSDEWCVVDNGDEGCSKEIVAAECMANEDVIESTSQEGDDAVRDTMSLMEHLSTDGHNSTPKAKSQMNVAKDKDNNWRFELHVGQLIDARDTDRKWYESRVVALKSQYVKVHYRGWTSKWDEWIERTSTRLAPLYTKIHNWRAFKAGDGVMVGRQVVGKTYPEWRNAIVTNCIESNGNQGLSIEEHTRLSIRRFISHRCFNLIQSQTVSNAIPTHN